MNQNQVLIYVLLVLGCITSSALALQIVKAQNESVITPPVITGPINATGLPDIITRLPSPLNTSGMLSLNGTIQVGPIISKAIVAEVKVPIAEAAASAQKQLGANSHITSLSLGIRNGYLVYVVRGLDSNFDTHNLWIDAATGKVILSVKLQSDTPIFGQ